VVSLLLPRRCKEDDTVGAATMGERSGDAILVRGMCEDGVGMVLREVFVRCVDERRGFLEKEDLARNPDVPAPAPTADAILAAGRMKGVEVESG
jgi:hypothetical protein